MVVVPIESIVAVMPCAEKGRPLDEQASQYTHVLVHGAEAAAEGGGVLVELQPHVALEEGVRADDRSKEEVRLDALACVCGCG